MAGSRCHNVIFGTCRHEKVPEYTDRVYESRLLAPSAVEALMYPHLLRRPVVSIKDAVQALTVPVTAETVAASVDGQRAAHAATANVFRRQVPSKRMTRESGALASTSTCCTVQVSGVARSLVVRCVPALRLGWIPSDARTPDQHTSRSHPKCTMLGCHAARL
jgi:hypothetical protein